MNYIKKFQLIIVAILTLYIFLHSCKEKATYDINDEQTNVSNNVTSNNSNSSPQSSGNVSDNPTSPPTNNTLKERENSILSINSKITEAVNVIAIDYFEYEPSFGDKFYIAGDFSYEKGSSFNHIAYWNGKEWENLNDGVNGPVYAVLVDKDAVYVGGQFDEAGHIPVKNIAKWSKINKEWERLDYGLGSTQNNDAVYALEVYNDKLYAGGKFSYSGSKTLWNIAVWDGNTWQALAHGLNDTVRAIKVFNNNIYASGDFTHCANYYCGGYLWENLPGSTTRQHIAMWNGTRWLSLPQGRMNGSGFTLHIYNNSLYIGGNFSTVANLPMNNLANFDTSLLWQKVSIYEPNAKVLALATVDNHNSGEKNLVVGGSFNSIGILNISKLAFFNFQNQQWFGIYPPINCDNLDVCEIRTLATTSDNQRVLFGGIINYGKESKPIYFGFITFKDNKYFMQVLPQDINTP